MLLAHMYRPGECVTLDSLPELRNLVQSFGRDPTATLWETHRPRYRALYERLTRLE